MNNWQIIFAIAVAAAIVVGLIRATGRKKRTTDKSGGIAAHSAKLGPWERTRATPKATTVEVTVRRPALPSGTESAIVQALRRGEDPDDSWTRQVDYQGSWGAFFSKVVGESFDNPDGVSRQTVLAGAKVGSLVWLVPEPTNAYDPNAIAVYVEDGSGGTRQIGYLPRDSRLVPYVAAGTIAAWLAKVSRTQPEAPVGAVLYVVLKWSD